MQSPSDAAAALVAAGARRVTARRDEFTAGMVAPCSAEIAPLPQDDQLVGLMAASTDENVVAVLRVLEHGLDVHSLEAPLAAVQFARRIAQRGIPSRPRSEPTGWGSPRSSS